MFKFGEKLVRFITVQCLLMEVSNKATDGNEFQNTAFLEGQQLTLECPMNLTADFYGWFFVPFETNNEKEVYKKGVLSGDFTKARVDKFTFSLSISSAKLEDAGAYICKSLSNTTVKREKINVTILGLNESGSLCLCVNQAAQLLRCSIRYRGDWTPSRDWFVGQGSTMTAHQLSVTAAEGRLQLTLTLNSSDRLPPNICRLSSSSIWRQFHQETAVDASTHNDSCSPTVFSDCVQQTTKTPPETDGRSTPYAGSISAVFAIVVVVITIIVIINRILVTWRKQNQDLVNSSTHVNPQPEVDPIIPEAQRTELTTRYQISVEILPQTRTGYEEMLPPELPSQTRTGYEEMLPTGLPSPRPTEDSSESAEYLSLSEAELGGESEIYYQTDRQTVRPFQYENVKVEEGESHGAVRPTQYVNVAVGKEEGEEPTTSKGSASRTPHRYLNVTPESKNRRTDSYANVELCPIQRNH